MTIKKAAKRFLTSVKTKTSSAPKRPAIKMLEKNEIEGIIREQAYKLFEQRRYTHGSDVDDWLERVCEKLDNTT